MINDPGSIRYHLEKAVYMAMVNRPGPVWIDIPMDVQYALIDADKLPGYDDEEESTMYCTDLSSVRDSTDRAILHLGSSKRPILLVGNGVKQAGCINLVKTLADSFDIPIIFSRFAHDLLPYSDPHNMGQGGIKGRPHCEDVMKEADLVLSLGCRMAPQLAGHNFNAFSYDARIIAVDIEEHELAKQGVNIDVSIQTNVTLFLQMLIDVLTEYESTRTIPTLNYTEWADHCRDLKERRALDMVSLQRDPIDLYYFMSKLDQASSKRHIFITDAGSNFYVGGQTFRFEHGQKIISSVTFAAMGLSIPLAIGAAVANPDAQILAVTGDGSLETNIQELKTISHYGLNIKLFVINNGGYLSMRNWQDNFFEGRRIDTEEQTGAGTLSMLHVATAFGLKYDVIRSHALVERSIEYILGDDNPAFIEVVCDDRQLIHSNSFEE
jgi:acetolactate synthase-1/2/3 large subunit